MQVVRCILRAQFGPEQLEQLLAVQLVSGRECEQFDKRFGLTQPPRLVADHVGPDRDAELAEQVEG